ncbi:Uncharacterised protein [Mycobacteroides abscessus subsp. abscessus]|nr:Uncharacterised protein [Mycobacteroides abscessus subsp. abscessus]
MLLRSSLRIAAAAAVLMSGIVIIRSAASSAVSAIPSVSRRYSRSSSANSTKVLANRALPAMSMTLRSTPSLSQIWASIS